MATLIQCNPQIEVLTPLGRGWTFFIIDYGLNINSIWVVRLNKTGEVKHIESNDIKIEGNPMLGLPLL
jgi:hypothetical protein